MYRLKESASRCCSASSFSRCARSLALRSFASLEMAASLFPCSTLLGSLTLSFSTEAILVSLFSLSIYLIKFSWNKLQGNFEQVLSGLQGTLGSLGWWWWCAHFLIPFSLGRGESYLKISFHAFRALGRLQTHQKPLPDVGVLVVLYFRFAAFAAHLSRNGIISSVLRVVGDYVSLIIVRGQRDFGDTLRGDLVSPGP